MKNLLAGLLINIFALAAISGLIIFDAKAVFLDPVTVKKVLAESNFYKTFLQNALPSLLSQQQGSSPEGPPLQLIGNLVKNIDPALLQKDVETVIDGTLPYLNSQKDQVNVKISLESYKNTLTKNFEPAFREFLASLPTCQADFSPSVEQEGFSCKPAGQTPEQILASNEVKELQKGFTTGLPNEILITQDSLIFSPPLFNAKDSSSTNKETKTSLPLPAVREGISKVGLIFYICVGAIIATLVLLALLWIKKPRAFFKWLAGGLMYTAAFPFLISGALLLSLNEQNLAESVKNVSGTNDNLGEFIGVLILAFVRAFSSRLAWQTGLMVAAAIGIFLIVFFVKPDQKSTPKVT